MNGGLAKVLKTVYPESQFQETLFSDHKADRELLYSSFIASFSSLSLLPLLFTLHSSPHLRSRTRFLSCPSLTSSFPSCSPDHFSSDEIQPKASMRSQFECPVMNKVPQYSYCPLVIGESLSKVN